jgi:predicted DNA-binding transcriptional regulator AlpA
MPGWRPGKAPPVSEISQQHSNWRFVVAVQSHEAGRRLLRPAEVERRWDVSRSTLRRWAKVGIGPRPVRLTDGTIRYELAAVEAFERALAGDVR